MFISYNFLNSFNSGDTQRVQISAREPCPSFPGHWLLLTTKGRWAHLFLLSLSLLKHSSLPCPRLTPTPVQSLSPQATTGAPVGGCGRWLQPQRHRLGGSAVTYTFFKAQVSHYVPNIPSQKGYFYHRISRVETF